MIWKALMSFTAMLALSTQLQASNETFRDRDWNVRAVDNCGFPNTSRKDPSVSWVRINGDKKLKFTLRQGEKGKCSTDQKPRHRAPYWERAEVRQDPKMRLGSISMISFEATFLEGFTGDRETFFQIHSWDNGCSAYPLAMMKSQKGRLVVWSLHKVSGDGTGAGAGQHREVQAQSVRIPQLYGKPIKFELDLDTRTSPGKLSVRMNGRTIVSDAATSFAPCARPHMKFGVYRPGGAGSSTSTVLIDDVVVKKGK
ncbi:heparin lyase I family protein [uncultured Lentibacter sp.]|jgi:hypothetical protein|uniref:heparin lyase I family protein n=1 Tax=uncultured Lentibacter sp. TaxID=1659309 RepID=UPI002601F3DC|nr:heparin lyase I family protein [uncultured Lentibacter sp.]